jgi:DNA adenine methylase
MTPLFTWAGGKRKMVKFYQPYLPKTVASYVEPFFGGGAIFAHLLPTKGVINDINWEIMDLYSLVKDDPSLLIKLVVEMEQNFLPLQKPDRKLYYYELRQRYWHSPAGEPATSALLFFLLRTCFNGIWQACVASGGRFGTPAGLLNSSKILDEDQVYSWSSALAKTKLMVGDYQKVKIVKGSFVFCDPPYRDSFADYNTSFGDEQQIELIDWARYTAKTTDSLVWVSNRDSGDSFWEERAPDAVIKRFPVTYTAGRRLQTKTDIGTSFSAKKAEEVLLMFHSK